MSKALARTILRVFHIILGIPILGVIYEPPELTQEYIGGVQYLFVPAMMLSGYWMYAGAIFAVIGVALWLGAFHFGGFGAALLSQVALFAGRIIWRAWSKKRKRAIPSI